MRLIYRTIEKFLCWYHRNDRPADVRDMVLHHGMKREPTRCIPVLINGVRLYVLAGMTLRGRPVAVCRYRGAHGPELDVKIIQGFYHGGRLYPGRFLHLYIKTGFAYAASHVRKTG